MFIYWFTDIFKIGIWANLNGCLNESVHDRSLMKDLHDIILQSQEYNKIELCVFQNMGRVVQRKSNLWHFSNKRLSLVFEPYSFDSKRILRSGHWKYISQPNTGARRCRLRKPKICGCPFKRRCLSPQWKFTIRFPQMILFPQAYIIIYCDNCLRFCCFFKNQRVIVFEVLEYFISRLTFTVGFKVK